MKRRSKNQMAALLLEWRESGLSQVEFCRTKSIGVSTFQTWLKKEKKFPRTPMPEFSFVEVVNDNPPASPQTRILRLSTSYGLLLEIPL